MNSTDSNSDLKHINQIQTLVDSIENVWSSISPVVRKSDALKVKYAKLTTLKKHLELKIQGDLKNENTK